MARFLKTIFLTAPLLLCACSSSAKLVKQDPRVNRVAHRQLAPEPVYHRLTWVRPPQVSPARDVVRQSDASERIKLAQIIEFNLEKGTLEQAAHMLASVARYHVYCASSISKKPFSYKGLGTIDELAETIANKAGISVTIDHANQSIRFLEGNKEAVEARLYYKG